MTSQTRTKNNEEEEGGGGRRSAEVEGPFLHLTSEAT